MVGNPSRRVGSPTLLTLANSAREGEYAVYSLYTPICVPPPVAMGDAMAADVRCLLSIHTTL